MASDGLSNRKRKKARMTMRKATRETCLIQPSYFLTDRFIRLSFLSACSSILSECSYSYSGRMILESLLMTSYSWMNLLSSVSGWDSMSRY